MTWPLARLGDLATKVTSGSTPSGGSATYLTTGPVMLVRSQNVRMNQLDLSDVAFIGDEVDAEMDRSRVEYDDVLLNITGASIGRVARFDRRVRANVNQHVCIIRSKQDRLCPRYLTLLISSPPFQRNIDRLQHGGTRQALTFELIKDFEIPLPPLAEQKRIAAVLDKADDLRGKRRQALATLDTLLQSVFLDMFGDPVTNPKKWPTKKLGDLLAFMTSGSRGWAAHYSESGALFLRIQNVGRNALLLDDIARVEAPDNAEAQRTRVEPGDVLVSVTADLGRTGVIPEGFGEAYINQHLVLLRPKGVESLFLSAFLTSPGGQRQLQRRDKKAVKSGLNFDDVRSVDVPIPPVAEQRRFASAYSAAHSERAAILRHTAELDTLFAALQSAAFAGTLFNGEMVKAAASKPARPTPRAAAV